MNQPCFTDKEMMNDVLSSQKFMTDGYNSTANEAKESTVRSAFMSILNDEHTIQQDVFNEMEKRGWYQTEQAPQNKIDETKQKFNAYSCCN